MEMLARDVEEEKVTRITEFIETKAPSHHGLFESQLQFDRQKLEYKPSVPNDLYQELSRAIEEALKNPKFQFRGTNIAVFCSNDVSEQMESLCKKIQDDHKSENGVVLNTWRKFGHWAEYLYPALDGIPDDMGLSVIHGGLALVFFMAKTNVAVRRKVRGAFEDIPSIIERLGEKRKQYRNADLDALANEVTSALLQAMIDLLDVLNPKSKRLHRGLKKLTVPFKGPDIDRILAGLQRQVKKFDARVEDLNVETALDTRRDVQALHHVIQTNGQATNNDLREVKAHLIDMKNILMSSIVKKLASDDRALKERQEAGGVKADTALEDTIEGHNALFSLLYQHALQTNLRQRAPEPVAPDLADNLRAEELMVELSDLLLARLEPTIGHVESILKRPQRSIGDAALQQARHLVKTEKYAQWMGSAESRILQVDAHFDLTKTNKTSAMSLLCAELGQAYLYSTQLTLQYFCSLNLKSDHSGLGGVVGLVRSLTVQLLCSPYTRGYFNLSFMDEDFIRDRIRKFELRGLFFVFRELLRQLPPGYPVYCFLDGVSYLERERAQSYEDLCEFFRELRGIVFDGEIKATVKILLAFPSRSRYLQEIIPRADRVSLQSKATFRSLPEHSFKVRRRQA